MTRYNICTVGLYACVVSFMAYHKIDGQGFTTLVVLMVFDTLFGIAKAYVLRGTTPDWFSTSRMKMGVISKVCIMVLVILLAMVVASITNQHEILNTTVGSILALLIVAEFISVIQNVIAIKKRKEIEEWDAISMVLSYLLTAIRTSLEKKIKPQGLPTEPEKTTES